MTLNQLIKILHLFQKKHPNIKDFCFGDPAKVKTANTKYPLMVVAPQPMSIGGNQILCRLAVLFLDRVESDLKNQKDVYNDMAELCKHLTVFFEDNLLNEIILEEEITFEPSGDERSSDRTSGWGGVVTVRLELDPSVCQIPGLEQLILEDSVITIGGSNSNLTCENILQCSSLLNVLSTKANHSGNTSFNSTLYLSGGTPLSTIIQNIASTSSSGGTLYSFSAGDNLQVSQSGNSISYSLSANPIFNDSVITLNNTIVDAQLNSAILATQVQTQNADIQVLYCNYGAFQNINSGGTDLQTIIDSSFTMDEFRNSDNNGIQISTGGTAFNRIIDFKLKDDVNIKNLTVGANLVANLGNWQVQNVNITAANSNIIDLQYLDANLIESSGVTSNYINSSLYYSGGTPFSNIFVLTGNQLYSETKYKNKGTDGITGYQPYHHQGNNLYDMYVSTFGRYSGETHYVPFIVTNQITIDELGMEINQAGSTGCKVRIGIYDSVNSKPKNLIYEFGEIDGDATGIHMITGFNLTLNPNLYFLCFSVNTSGFFPIYFNGIYSNIYDVLGYDISGGFSIPVVSYSVLNNYAPFSPNISGGTVFYGYSDGQPAFWYKTI